MNFDNSFQTKPKLRKCKIRFLSLYIFFLFFSLLAVEGISQEIEYTTKGRIVDGNGKPKSKIAIFLSPVKNSREEGTFTDEKGLFSLTQKHQKGAVWYLYTIDGSTFSKNEWSLLYPTFFDTGQPIKFGDEPIIDVGDVKVRTWYVDVNLKIQKDGKNLTEKQWEHLWCRLKNEKGEILVESSIAPNITNKVDIEKSLLKLSLPEGKWKLEFQGFDYDKVKVYPKVIGQTSYFIIDKKRKTEMINISLLK